jgi:signal transduction histidine kinase
LEALADRGRLYEWIGTITDVEDRKKLDEQMRQTQKLESLGVLAGGVAHDFNNLLVGILGNSTLALETLSSNNPARTMLRDVISASETAAHLTKQLLAYAGKGRFVVQPVDVSELIEQIKTLVQATIPKNVQLRLELQRKLPCVEADLSQLQQLMMNLIINGAEAIPEGQAGTVLVTTGVQDIDDGYSEAALPGAAAGNSEHASSLFGALGYDVNYAVDGISAPQGRSGPRITSIRSMFSITTLCKSQSTPPNSGLYTLRPSMKT